MQMVTVWPVTGESLRLRWFAYIARHDDTAARRICPDAAALYDYTTASAWRAKAQPRIRFTGRGPVLVAWAPARLAGDPRAPVLTFDLSRMETPDELVAALKVWKTDIENDPQLWAHGWDMQRWRLTSAAISDRYGKQIGDAIKLVPWLHANAGGDPDQQAMIAP